MSVPIVEEVSAVITVVGCIKHVSARTTVDHCVCVCGATYQCSDHCGLVYQIYQ